MTRDAAPQAIFRPRRVLDIDLADPIPGIALHDAEGRRFGGAWVLVRLHHLPIGIVEIDRDHECIDAVSVAAEINDRHGAAIAAHLAGDGMTQRSAPACGAGWSDELACRAAVRRFLAHAPPVTVVVPTVDRPEQLTVCLSGLLDQDYPVFEIVVVDNAKATSGARDAVQALSGATRRPIRYVTEDRIGSSRARNRGLAESRTGITAFVDGDVRVDRHWLGELVRPIMSAPDIGAATGLILPAELDTQAQVWMWELGGFDKGFATQVFHVADRGRGALYPFRPTIFGSGSSMAFRTDLLRRLGGFDVALGPGTASRGGEDGSALLEVVLSGHRLVYTPAAIVWHPDVRDESALLHKLATYSVGLSALITRTVVAHPSTAIRIAAGIPCALRLLASRGPHRNRRETGSFPTRCVRAAELRGLASGPFAYLLSRRVAQRRTALARQSALSH